MNPDDLRYTEEHEWIGELGGQYFVGITDYAQAQLGDITYIELPEVGREVEAGEEVAAVESVKAASDIYAPVSGTVVEINEALESRPELVNKAPYGGGWFFKLEEVDATEFDALMDISAYRAFVESLG
ncbi:MAG: glycine cleavage system protein GcvH [Candidatus Hydrogenedentes bacterium]|nr:glycine cleavage system protein GcvH [Candidatus Hydrogenedentota bacterium]